MKEKCSDIERKGGFEILQVIVFSQILYLPTVWMHRAPGVVPPEYIVVRLYASEQFTQHDDQEVENVCSWFPFINENCALQSAKTQHSG